jgi:hypothetical protein
VLRQTDEISILSQEIAALDGDEAMGSDHGEEEEEEEQEEQPQKSKAELQRARRAAAKAANTSWEPASRGSFQEPKAPLPHKYVSNRAKKLMKEGSIYTCMEEFKLEEAEWNEANSRRSVAYGKTSSGVSDNPTLEPHIYPRALVSHPLRLMSLTYESRQTLAGRECTNKAYEYSSRCPDKTCRYSAVASYQCSLNGGTGGVKLIKFTRHSCSNPVKPDKRTPSCAYTTKQLAQVVKDDLYKDPKLSNKFLRGKLNNITKNPVTGKSMFNTFDSVDGHLQCRCSVDLKHLEPLQTRPFEPLRGRLLPTNTGTAMRQCSICRVSGRRWSGTGTSLRCFKFHPTLFFTTELCSLE